MTHLTTEETGGTWSSGRATTLHSLLAEQRLAEVARGAERRQHLLLVSDSPSERVLLWSLAGGVSALRVRLGRAIEVDVARADAGGRTAPSGPDAGLVCCA